MNPLMQSMNGPKNMTSGAGINQQAIQQIKRMMAAYSAAKNPAAVLQQLAQQNPMVGQLMQLCSGKGLKESFYQMCQEQGVDPQAVLNALGQ